MSKDLKTAVNKALNIVALECDDDEGYIRNLVEGAWQGEAEAQLAKLGDAAIPLLIKSLTTYDNSKVICFVAHFLADRKITNGIKPLIKIMLNEQHNDDVRQFAANALGEIGDAYAVNALLKVLKEPPSQYNAKYVRGTAAEALGKIGDQKAIKPLIKFAANENLMSLLRNRAINALAQFANDDQVLKLLLKTLQDKNNQVREASARSLGILGNILAFDQLVKTLSDTYSLARSEAARSLFQLDKFKAIDILLAALQQEKDSYVCTNIIELLGQAKDPRATAPLIKLLDHKNSDVQVAAAKALAQIGAREAVEQLCQLLRNASDSYIRWNVADSLGILANKRAVTTLIMALKDKEAIVRMQAVNALIKLPSKLAIAPLIAGLKEKDSFRQPKLSPYQVCEALVSIGNEAIASLVEILNSDEEEIVKDCAIAALRELGDSSVVPLFVKQLDSGVIKTIQSAVSSLVKLDQPAGLAVLKQALSEKSLTERLAIIDQLAKNNSQRVVNLLIPLLKDNDIVIRLAVTKTFINFGGVKVVEPLISILKDNDISIVKLAVTALGKLGSKQAIPSLELLAQQYIDQEQGQEQHQDLSQAITATLQQIQHKHK